MTHKQQEIEARQSVIRGWLESGMPTRTVATMISARFSVSRSTAYNEINTVSKQIDLSDDGPSIEESEAIFDQQALLASLQYQFDVSAAVGDTKSACQLVKAMDTIRKWSGRSMQSTEPTNHPFS
jgi:hypothetical protein